MGAWGEGLLANDDAGDLQVSWEQHILPLQRQGPDTWTPDRIADFFSHSFGFDLLTPLSAELEPDRLQAWISPGKRRRVLVNFLKAIGAPQLMRRFVRQHSERKHHAQRAPQS